MSPAPVHDAQELIASARAKRDATIPAGYLLPKSAYPLPKNVTPLLETSGILDERELGIVALNATRLAAAIVGRQYTAVEVSTAYCKAAALAQQATNCLVELFEPEALERAAWLDAKLAETGMPVGPFHGIPVSVKDHIDVQGHDSPSAFLSMVDKNLAKEDAHMISVLRDAGAVFYCKTTNPQSLMHLETECYLGRTSCPYNTDLTAGGSSGGEGALIGMKASPFGIGTDIGGSIRSPAAACGVYSFKPSAGRVPYGGCNTPVSPTGWEGVLCSHGPMGRSVEDMELYLRTMAGTEPWRRDPSLHVKPWRDVSAQWAGRKIRIGILRDDGVVMPVAPIRRALDHAAEVLRKSADFEVVEYAPFKSAEAWKIISASDTPRSALYWPDNGKMAWDALDKSGEPVSPLTEWVIREAGGRQRTADELIALVAERDGFRQALARHWADQNVDVVLSPVGPSPAPRHGTAKYWNYTSYWNLANYPAAVFPTGMYVDPTMDCAEKTDEPTTARNESEKYMRETYDPATSIGAPLGLQVIGYIGYEEDTMYAFKKIAHALGQ